MSDHELAGPNAAGLSAEDRAHLDTLGIVHWIFAGLNALGCLGVAAYGVFMTTILKGATEMDPQAEEFAGVFAGVLGAIVVIGVVFQLASGLLHWFCGSYLRQRRNRTFCLVVAALSLLSIPLGTILGVFTIVVLARPQVQEAFD